MICLFRYAESLAVHGDMIPSDGETYFWLALSLGGCPVSEMFRRVQMHTRYLECLAGRL